MVDVAGDAAVLLSPHDADSWTKNMLELASNAGKRRRLRVAALAQAQNFNREHSAASVLEDRIYVAGHRGMVGSAIIRKLNETGYGNIITRSHSELDLIQQTDVKRFFKNERIDQVYMAAAKVGGIFANHSHPAEFIYQNLMVEANIIHEAWQSGVKRLLFLARAAFIRERLRNQ